MSAFVISKRQDGKFKFIYASRKGKAIFTSISCREKSDCEMIIAAIRDKTSDFTFTKNWTNSEKCFFRISKGGLVVATSRKFSTERMLKKGIEQILKYVPKAETLDFSQDEDIFAEKDTTVNQV